jgi:hypothetical protein
MKLRSKALCLFASLVLFSSSEASEINGQVFIATQGGVNYKLALVPVELYRFGDVEQFVASKDAMKKNFEPKLLAKSQWASARQKEASDAQLGAPLSEIVDRAANEDRALSVSEYWSQVVEFTHSSFYYFEGFPSPVAITKTDPEGKFVLAVPETGTWVLKAKASRSAGDTTEYYSWLVKVEVKGGDATSVMLANDNLFGVNSEDAVVAHASRDSAFALQGMEHIAEAEQKLNDEEIEQKRVESVRQEALRREILANLPQLVKESQARALSRYPDLGRAGSTLNKMFVSEYRKLSSEKSPRLQEPDWPETLARECATNTPSPGNQ